jgi:hypothetical protein
MGKVMYHRDYWDAAEEVWEKRAAAGCAAAPPEAAFARRFLTRFKDRRRGSP